MTPDEPPPTTPPRRLDPDGSVRYRPGEGRPQNADPAAGGRPPRRRPRWPPAVLAATVAALAGLGIGAALWSGDEPEQQRPAAAAPTTPPETEPSTQPAPEPEPEPEAAPEPEPEAAPEPEQSAERRAVRMRFKRLRGGLRGRAEVSLTPRGGGSALMSLTATVPRAQFAVYLVRDGLRRKRLASARGGRIAYKQAVAVRALARRYDGIEVVAERLPSGRRTRPRRSLRVSTSTLVRRLARRRAGG